MSQYVDIPILTGMGNARNIINVLTSKIIIAIGEGPGTLSEVALALKTGKPVIGFHLASHTIITLNSLTEHKIIAFNQYDEKSLTEILNKTFEES